MRITKEELRNWIRATYRFNKDFIEEFNEEAESNDLDAETLSRQLAGVVGISKGYDAAYKFFIKLKDS